jgi:maltoporin
MKKIASIDGFRFALPILLILLLVGLNQSAFSGVHEIGSHSYFRLGTGTSTDGEKACYQAPGAGAKYRLGNECDSWVEIAGYDTYRLGDSKDDTYIHTEGLLTFSGPDEKLIQLNDIGQLYIELGNFSKTLNHAKVWVGRRWYDRHDIHINDYFFLNMVGDGGGIRDLDIGFADFAYTYLQEEETPNITSLELNSKVAHRSHDFRFYNIPTNEEGSLLAFFNYSNIVGREIKGEEQFEESRLDNATSINIADADGWALGLVHKQDHFFGGYNKLSMIYGKGTARNAGAWAFEGANAIGKLITTQQADKLKEASTFRITNQTVVENPQWAMMTGLVYEKKEHFKFDGIDQTWLSFGIRPVKFITKHFRILGELGYDWVDNHATGTHGSLRKLTLAGELAEKRGFWVRPVIRAYATYAQWSDEFRGQIGGETYANNTSGWSAGIQVESWW